MVEQIPFGGTDFPPNPEQRCPCVLLLDVSGSMQGVRIEQLNQGLVAYKNDVMGDSLASQRVEVAVLTFGGSVDLKSPFMTMDHFMPPTLTAGGTTPMGEAIRRGIDMVQERKKYYRDQGLPYLRPWLFLITDGEPTDEWQTAAARVREGEAAKQFVLFAVGVEEANMQVLQAISARQPLQLKGLQFNKLFEWLSRSQRSISRSKPGQEDKVHLENPATPSGWATI